MSNPFVSIIIPVYNAEKHLDEAINSAIGQTWQNKEIILVDDGSSDNSLAIATKYKNNGVKIFTQPNAGASAARNKGLKEAIGDYIQFLDADDCLSSNKIELQVNQLINHPEHLALCSTIHFQDGTDPSSLPLPNEWFAEGSEDPADFLIKLYGGAEIGPAYGGMIQPNSWLTPRNIIDRAGLWNEELTVDDDGEFFCRAVLSSKGVVYAKGAKNYYRKFDHGNSLSGKSGYLNMVSIQMSTDLKAKHLLSNINNANARLALSRLYYHNASNFYPKYKDLATDAEMKAKSLSPNFRYTPFNQGVTLRLSKIFGWKAVSYLQYLKNDILFK